jgi:hypothetical protein
MLQTKTYETALNSQDAESLKMEFESLQQQYTHIHTLGYRKMPKEMYMNWLLDVEERDQEEKSDRHTFEAPQPFAQYGYKVKTATLSNGRYQEFFDLENTLQIGSVLFDRTTNSIVGFVTYDTVRSEATLAPEVISRWLNIDPLAERMYEWSPYNFSFNNPVRFTDPTGLAPEDSNNPIYEVTSRKYKDTISTTKTIETPTSKVHLSSNDPRYQDALTTSGVDPSQVSTAIAITSTVTTIQTTVGVRYDENGNEIGRYSTETTTTETSVSIGFYNNMDSPIGGTTINSSDVSINSSPNLSQDMSNFVSDAVNYRKENGVSITTMSTNQNAIARQQGLQDTIDKYSPTGGALLLRFGGLPSLIYSGLTFNLSKSLERGKEGMVARSKGCTNCTRKMTHNEIHN